MNEHQIRCEAAQEVAVAALERRARDDDAGAGALCFAEARGDREQPVLAVVVRQRDPGRHAPHVLWWMKGITFDELDVQRAGEVRSDQALPRAADAHHHVEAFGVLAEDDEVHVLDALALERDAVAEVLVLARQRVGDARQPLRKGVWIGDTSAFPTPTGANPMLTCMALAHRTAEAIAGKTEETHGSRDTSAAPAHA